MVGSGVGGLGYEEVLAGESGGHRKYNRRSRNIRIRKMMPKKLVSIMAAHVLVV